MKFARAWIDKTSLEAGTFATVAHTLEVGHPVDDTGCIKIAFRYAGDFGTPQFIAPGDENFCSVSTDGNCRIEPRWDPKGHLRPWGKALYLKVMGGFLDRGDTVTVVFGDTSGGSPGWQIQTFCEESFEFKTFIDPFATYRFKELEQSPTMKIVPCKPVKAVCVAPSQVAVDAPFAYRVYREDRWGNIVNDAASFHHPGFATAAICRIEHDDPETGLRCVSNPMDVFSDKPERSCWWADFHGQSEETIGSNAIEAYFRYARRCACLDIVAHQGNDFQITDAFWDKINRIAKENLAPGEFVTFPGFEWSGNTPLGGDRNVYYKNENQGIHRSSHDLLPDEHSKYPQAPTADELFKRLDPEQAFAFAHVGGRYADIAMHDDSIEVAMEVHSAWGTFEWLVFDALRAGYRVGICANSDGHKCRPGASYPGASRFGSYGGLTCVLADKLDRESVFRAMKARHFYATTGNRPLLDLKVMTACGREAIMGDIVETTGASLKVAISATAPIDYVEVFNGPERIRRIVPVGEQELGNEVKVVWSGAEVKGRDRKSTWDGALAVEGNAINAFRPFNFWNPDRQPEWHGDDKITWRSITTGGCSGLILELESPDHGKLKIDTAQVQCEVEIETLGMRPLRFDAGGIGKKLEIYRLAAKDKRKNELKLELELPELKTGDNPVFVKIVQQDGHMAWSSPVYLVRKP